MQENIVYFFGAGFSAPLNLPVMSDFLEKSKDMYRNEKNNYGHFGEVIEKIGKVSVIKNYYSADLFNIEEMLSILEMEDFIDETKNSEKYKRYIKEVIEYFTPDFKNIFSGHRPGFNNYLFGEKELFNQYGYFIGNLINLILSQNLRHKTIFCPSRKDDKINYSVISLNYDMIIEKFLDLIADNFATDYLMGKNISYGIQKDEKKNDYFLYVTKLHGSVRDGKIILPTWNKGGNIDILPNWKTAASLIRNANQIRIIGYSLPVSDSYVKYLFKSAIMGSEHLRKIDVLCLDRYGDVKERYDKFITYNNYRFKNTDITKYLKENYEIGRKRIRNTSDPNILEITFNSLEEAHEKFMSS